MIEASPGQLSLIRLLAGAGMLGGFAFVVMMFYLHGVDGARWTHRLVSEYAYGRHATAYTAALQAHGAGNLALAAALYLARPGDRRMVVVAALYGLAGLGIMVAGIVKTAPSGSQTEWMRNPHQIVVAVVMVVQTAALFAFARIAVGLVLQTAYRRFSTALPWLCGAGIIWLAIALFVFNHAGLAERMVIALFLAWQLWSAALLIARPERLRPTPEVRDGR